MKKTAGILLIAAGVCAAAAYWVDLMNFTDLSKGFAAVGSVWLRYGVLAALLLITLLASGMAARQPAAFAKRNLPAAFFSWLCAAALGAWGALETYAALNGRDTLMLVLGVLALLGAWWMFLQGLYWAQRNAHGQPACPVVFGILGSLVFLLMTCVRFAKNASSLYRFAQTTQVFSALAALLFTTVLLRTCFFAETARGRKVYCSGMWAFYLCTCFELPQAAARWMAGQTQIGDFALSAVLGCIGLLGAACALASLSGEAQPEEDGGQE